MDSEKFQKPLEKFSWTLFCFFYADLSGSYRGETREKTRELNQLREVFEEKNTRDSSIYEIIFPYLMQKGDSIFPRRRRYPLYKKKETVMKSGSWRRILSLGLAFGFFAASSALQAEELADHPTFLFDLKYGLSTTKSKLVGTNDTGSSVSYGVGGFAGGDKQIEYGVGFETDATSFKLNTSKVSYDWQDTRLAYHYGWAYAGVIFSRLNTKLNKEGTELADASGSGYGGSVGILTDVGRSGLLRIDVSQVNIAQMKNADEAKVSVTRLDIDIGASVLLYKKWLLLDFGYKMRNLGVKVDASAADAETMTYVGLRFATSH